MLIAFLGIMIPFIGTTIGSAAVFAMKKINSSLQKAVGAFAGGVMVAASVWSLIIPAVEMREDLKGFAFLPVTAGIVIGFAFMIAGERLVIKSGENQSVSGRKMQFFAVTVHNFPEGMAVGMMFSLWLSEGAEGLPVSCFAFSLAIALQNIPEGAIISMPHYADGNSKAESFLLGVASGAVEPLGGLITFAATGFIESILSYLFGFAAGAMLYAVCDGLMEKEEGHSFRAPLCFGIGFCIMMIMDIALG